MYLNVTLMLWAVPPAALAFALLQKLTSQPARFCRPLANWWTRTRPVEDICPTFRG